MLTGIIVEDAALQRRVLDKMLRQLGFETVLAANLHEARELCVAALPNMALVDWNLPDGSGGSTP
ncbi:response regulator [Telmatospirillum siberiense]|uniref:Response regulatory domain-containing protein n=1 Tax=Telmatospirillum siberiense TaxID=382514 RepID=A0A2N3PS94_9PROT|nr:hypothetical protein CWS72_17755 [Telmatospirillum siberiense]